MVYLGVMVNFKRQAVVGQFENLPGRETEEKEDRKTEENEGDEGKEASNTKATKFERR